MAVEKELFIVKVWREVVNIDQTEWRGKIQHVKSGQVRYFRDLSTMLAFLVDILPLIKVQSEQLEVNQIKGGSLVEKGEKARRLAKKRALETSQRRGHY